VRVRSVKPDDAAGRLQTRRNFRRQFRGRFKLDGRSKIDAMREACRDSVPTDHDDTAATVAGHFPLTPVQGPGAATRHSIGLVLVGGMTVGTIFTLMILPSVYVLLARDHSKDLPKLAAVIEPDATATHSA
jgi:multidrug efflux pump